MIRGHGSFWQQIAKIADFAGRNFPLSMVKPHRLFAVVVRQA